MTSATLTYYVGDVHGRHDLLSALLRWIEADAEKRGREPCVVFLGDIVDRGPDSRECMDAVLETLRKWPASRLILGNHDEWFLDAVLTDGSFPAVDSWILHGGIATIESYCGDLDAEALRVVRERHPEHLELLRSADRILFTGPFVAVHAGIDPTLPLDAQKEYDLNWIRDRFLGFVCPEIGPVVHGHTVVGRLPVVTENRVSIDTGAYHHGLLTCFAVDFDKQDARFAQASEAGVNLVAPVELNRGHGTVMDRLPDLLKRPDPAPAR